ncbi:PilZ domain-containing protein [bacterium]|nr:PilZ domain-containing protein [bacterium]
MNWWNAFFKKPEQLENRRVHQRLSLELPVVYHPRPDHEILGRVRDLSLNGCQAELGSKVELPKRLSFKIMPGLELPGTEQHQGRLVWWRFEGERTVFGLDDLPGQSCLAKLYERLVRPHRPCQSIDPRRFIRFSGPAVLVALENLTVGWEAEARVCELSLGGCKLLTPKDFARIGHFVRLTFRGFFGVTVVGQVVRQTGDSLAINLDPSGVGPRFRSLLGRLARSGQLTPTPREELCLSDLIDSKRPEAKDSGESPQARTGCRASLLRRTRRCPSLWSARCLIPCNHVSAG